MSLFRTAWILPLALVAVAAGCGGTSTHRTKTEAATAPAAKTSTGAAATAPSSDCNTRGINPTGMREGTCTHAGITWVIVDQNHTLKLKTLWASLTRVRAAKTLPGTGATTAGAASGRFVIASVILTNKLPSPQGFDRTSTEQAELILDGALFREAAGAENEADPNACVKLASSIPPGQSQACDVIFDVPPHAAADLGRHGSGDLYLVNFGSDLAAGTLPQTIGQIRLYR